MIAIKSNIMKCLPFVSLILLLFVSLTACNEEATPTEFSPIEKSNGMLSKGRVIHHVSVGGPDVDLAGPGGDANFSLVANEKSDGSVSGQWQDTFAGGEGVHVAVDYIKVIDNWAIVGGVITHGTAGGVDVSGQRVVTAVVDNGTSKNDPPDQISFSFLSSSAINLLGTDDCALLDIQNFIDGGFLFDMTKGQVTVK